MLEEVVAVAVAVEGPLRDPLLRLVDGAMGWPVVPVGDQVLPPRCVIVDVPSVARRRGGAPAGTVGVPSVGPPTVLLVAEHDDPLEVAAAARGAAAVLAAPTDAPALRAAVSGLREVRVARPWCIVAGSAGGVGTTTVAGAVAGLRAWRHGPTLLAAPSPTHVADVPTVAPTDLAGPALWAAATPVAGVRDLRAVQVAGRGAPTGGAVATVLDVGVVRVRDGATDNASSVPDVLVVRPDRAGLDAVGACAAPVVVVVGDGVLRPATTRAVAGRPCVTLPWSARVAAAAARGRLPADLPGRWLAPLDPVVARLEARAGAAA